VERKSGFIILTNGDNGGKVFSNHAFGELMNRLLAGPQKQMQKAE